MEKELLYLLEFSKNLYKGKNLDNCISFVRRLDGELVFVSPGLCRMLGYQSFEEILQKNFYVLLEQHSNYSKENMLITNDKLIQGCEIVDVVVKIKNSENLLLFSLMPIHLEDGTIVGVYAIGRYTNLPSHMEILLKHSKFATTIYDKVDMNIELSSRDQIIVFLLVAGFTQEEVAQYLGCSRGHIAKVIATEICPKFGLKGSSTKGLVKLAIQSGVLNSKIPEDIADKLKVLSLSL